MTWNCSSTQTVSYWTFKEDATNEYFTRRSSYSCILACPGELTGHDLVTSVRSAFNFTILHEDRSQLPSLKHWKTTKKYAIETDFRLFFYHSLILTLKKVMSVNITKQRICRVISQQMLYFSQHFAEKCCLENACCVMFTDICYHLTDMTFLGEFGVGCCLLNLL